MSEEFPFTASQMKAFQDAARQVATIQTGPMFNSMRQGLAEATASKRALADVARSAGVLRNMQTISKFQTVLAQVRLPEFDVSTVIQQIRPPQFDISTVIELIRPPQIDSAALHTMNQIVDGLAERHRLMSEGLQSSIESTMEANLNAVRQSLIPALEGLLSANSAALSEVYDQRIHNEDIYPAADDENLPAQLEGPGRKSYKLTELQTWTLAALIVMVIYFTLLMDAGTSQDELRTDIRTLAVCLMGAFIFKGLSSSGKD